MLTDKEVQEINEKRLKEAFDPEYNTPQENGLIRYWTEEEVKERKSEEELFKLKVQELPLDEKLAGVIETLPLDIQVKYAPLVSSGLMYLKLGKLEHLKRLIEMAPDNEDLKEVKALLMKALDG